MSRTSSIDQRGFDWQGYFGARARGGSSRKTVRRGAARFATPVEPLEDRRLLSVTLVSANTLGQAAGTSNAADQAALSDDGQWIAFVSSASAVDLGAGNVTDSPDTPDVFLKNLQSGAVTLVSALNGAAVGGTTPSVSSDGRYVAFTTNASGFATGAFTDTNGSSNDVYVFDRQTGAYALASAANGGTAAVGSSIQPSLSNNGRVVAFVSAASAGSVASGVSEAGGITRDVFVRNLDTNQTVLVSVNTAGTATGNALSEHPSISGDGNFVAFESAATDLSAVADTGTATDVFRRAVAGTTTDLVSISANGGGTPASGASPSLNADGSLVAFESGNQSLAANDPSSSTIDVIVRNMALGVNEAASTSAAGAFGDSNSRSPVISDDGTHVAFQSSARNLTADVDATGTAVFVKSRADASIVRVSQTDAGQPATAGAGGVSSNFPSINANGTAVSFVSQATNFAPGTEDPAAATDDLFLWRSGNVLPGDGAAPTAAITAPNVTAAGGTSQQITVVYTDNVAIDASTLGTNDITVTGPGGAPLPVTTASATPSTNAAAITVVYTVNAPGGTWDAADNGTYTVTLPADAVRDTSAAGVAATTQTFVVDTTGGTPGGPGADLVATILPKPLAPTAVVGNTKGQLRLLVTNQGDTPVAARAVNILLQAVPTGSTTGAPTDIVTITRPIKLRAGKSRAVPLKFTYPGVPDGTYNLVATVDSAGAVVESNDSNNTATTAAPVTIAAPFVDLTAEVGAPTRGSLSIGRRGVVPVILTNAGNSTASGLVTMDLFASTDNVIGGVDDVLLTTVTKRIKLRNGKPRPIRVNFLVPTNLAAGSYFIATAVDTTNTIVESHDDNNTAVSGTPFQVA